MHLYLYFEKVFVPVFVFVLVVVFAICFCYCGCGGCKLRCAASVCETRDQGWICAIMVVW